MKGAVNPEEALLLPARLRRAHEVTGDDPAAVEEDRRPEKRARELARTERGARSEGPRAAWLRNPPGEEEEGKGRPKGGRPA